MKGLVIRQAAEKDLKAVQDLNYDLFLSDDEWLNDLNTDWPYQQVGEQYFKDRIAGKNGVCFVAEQDGKVVGYVNGGWSHLDSVGAYKGRRAELENICVAAEMRSQGVGAKLVEALYDWCRQNGAEYVMVDVYSANTKAYDFYKKHGFEDYSTNLWHKL